jgi:hypothetical protein
MSRFKVLSKRNAIILALMAVFSIMISAFFIVDSANNAYASDTGSGGVTGGTWSGGGASNDLHWFYGDLGGNANDSGSPDSIKTFLQNKGTDTTANSSTFSSWVTQAYNSAITDCDSNSKKAGHKCTSPRVVAIAYQTAHGSMYPATKGLSTLNMNQVRQCIVIKVKGNSVSTCDNMNGGSISDQLVNHTSNSSFVSIVVLADWQYQQTGWKQSWSVTNYSDVKSMGTNDAADLTECPVYYNVYANGFDGYAKGESSAVKQVLTPYGELYNVIASGKGSWTDKEGGTHTWMQADKQPQKDYGSNPEAATARAVADIKAAHDVACKETYNMKISYDLVSDGGDAGKLLNKQFAKGGQYKLVKYAINAALEVHQLNLKYQWRTSDFHHFNGWVQCNAGESGCGRIGQGKPSNSAADHNGKDYYNVGPWRNVADKDVSMIKNVVATGGNNSKINGRPLKSVKSANDATIAWNTSKGVVWNDPSSVNKNKWIFGSNTGYIDGSKFYGVAQDKKSPTPVAMQDFLNINCNQSDFEKIKNWAAARGILDSSSVKSTKYNGYFATTIMTGSNAEPEAQQKMWRALEIMTNTEGLTPAGYVSGSYPGVTSLAYKKSDDGKYTITWESATGDTAGDLDPVYTKECPYDCTATPTSSSGSGTTLPDHLDNGNFSYPAATWTKGNNVKLSSTDPNNGKYVSHWTYDGKNNQPGNSQYSGSWDSSKFAWHTTQRDRLVEINWDDQDANQYGEIIAEEKNTALYQDVDTTPGAVYTWTIKHASQNNRYLDKMSVLIGAPGEETAQEATRTTVNGNGDKIGDVGTVIATKVSNSDDSSHKGQWETYTGTYIVPAGQTKTRFSFKSVDSVNSNTGNAIDDISFSAKYPSNSVNDNNIRTNGASDADKAKNSYGINVKLPDTTGDDQVHGDGSSNTADAVAFRNNEYAQLDLDVWSPISSGGIVYGDTPATTTTIVRNDGTPWKIDGSVATKMQGSPDGSTWTDINFGSNVGAAGSQWSGADPSSHTGNYATYNSVQIPRNFTKIRIKSPWASDKDNGLEFNIKWEYLADNQVRVLSNWEVDGNGTAWGNNAVHSLSTTTTQVDGKCEAQYHNSGQSYVDHKVVAQENTGRNVENKIDAAFRDRTNLIGWFGVTFARATSE